MIPFAPAGVMELVDVLDSKSSAARRAGSSPATGTNEVDKFRQEFVDFPFTELFFCGI